jgi:hypothetical protein
MNRQGSDHPGSSFQSHGEGHQQTNNGGEAEHPQQMQEEGGAAGRTILPVGRGSRESSARQSYDRRIRHRTPLVDHSPRPSPGRPRSTINDTRWQSLNGRPAGQRGLDGRRPSSRSSSITSTTSRLGSAATRADGGSPSALAHIWRTGLGTARPSVTSGARRPHRVPALGLRVHMCPQAPAVVNTASMGPGAGSSGLLSPQLTAFFTSAPILASSAAVNSVSAKEVGHMAPSSRFAVALKPNVAYLSLNFDAGVK